MYLPYHIINMGWFYYIYKKGNSWDAIPPLSYIPHMSITCDGSSLNYGFCFLGIFFIWDNCFVGWFFILCFASFIRESCFRHCIYILLILGYQRLNGMLWHLAILIEMAFLICFPCLHFIFVWEINELLMLVIFFPSWGLILLKFFLNTQTPLYIYITCICH